MSRDERLGLQIAQVHTGLVHSHIAERLHKTDLRDIALVGDFYQGIVRDEKDRNLGWLVDKVWHPAHASGRVEDVELG